MRDLFHEELDAIGKQLVEMTRLAGSAMARATTALLDADLKLAESVIEADDLIDDLRHDLESRALDLEKGVFRKRSAHDIAVSLKRSAEGSRRRKAAPLPSAMSMLTFYINRAGKELSQSRRRTLEKAKDELRKLFH